MTNSAPSPTPPQGLTTAIAVVLDETGSMESCRDAAIAGFNDWLSAQQTATQPGAAEQSPASETTLTLVQFSKRPDLPMCRLVHEGVPLAAVRPLNRESYTPEGGTPLLDAVGRTIMWMDRQQAQPDRTLIVILTDGEENASREFSVVQIRDLIRSREAIGTWTFVYLAANQDAWAVAELLGMKPGNAVSFHVGEARQAFHRVSQATTRFRRRSSLASGDFWEGTETPGPAPASTPPA